MLEITLLAVRLAYSEISIVRISGTGSAMLGLGRQTAQAYFDEFKDKGWVVHTFEPAGLSHSTSMPAKTLEEHYDARSEEQKRELRREMLDIE